MTTAQLQLLRHQRQFCTDNEHKFLALIGGYGSGKSRALAAKAVMKCILNPGLEGGILSPTLGLAKDVLVPAIDEVLTQLELQYQYTASPQPIYRVRVKGKTSRISIRSFENTKRLVGSNWAWAGIDEIDTVEPKLARRGLQKVIGRCRIGTGVAQIFMVSTPEGYRLMWEFFERDAYDEHGNMKSDRRIIRAKSTDNPFLDASFLDSMRNQYSPELLKAYMEGQFCNLEQLTVYSAFDRELNHCDDVVEPFDALHIGMDFNIGQMAAIVHVLRDNKPRAVEEHLGILDTPTMVKVLQAHYGTREIYIYPDASGKNRDTGDASTTDLSLLRDAGFRIITGASNPPVKDRINAMNAAFLNANGDRRYLVNTLKCPKYTDALEQQAWVNGLPDKSNNIDHPLDAAGYFIFNQIPVNKPVAGVFSVSNYQLRGGRRR
jgi:phage terminase large subunit